MSATDSQTSKDGVLRRAWAFARELWGVLVRPSAVFGLGVLVIAGFVAGVIFWAASIPRSN